MNIEERLSKIEAEIFKLKYESKVFWKNLSMSAPEWAVDAVKAAEAAGLKPNNQGGSYDFFRLLVLMYEHGLFNQRG